MRTHCKIFVGDAQTSLDGWFAVLPRVGEWVTLAGSDDERLHVSTVHHRVAVSENDDALVAIYLQRRDGSLL